MKKSASVVNVAGSPFVRTEYLLGDEIHFVVYEGVKATHCPIRSNSVQLSWRTAYGAFVVATILACIPF